MTTRKMLAMLAMFFTVFSMAKVVGAHDRGSSKTAVVVAGGIIGVIGLFSLLSRSRVAEVDETAIVEEQKTRREQIRASTVLAARSALGGNGNAGYSSSEGFANISANVGNSSSGEEEARDPLSSGSEDSELPQQLDSNKERLSKIDVVGFQSAGELLADKMTSQELRAFGYALREVENMHHPDYKRRTHRDFTVPMLYDLLFKLKGVGTEEQTTAWLSVIRYLEKAGDV